jgi:RNA polymerase sigma factor (sigma-70 family)
VSANQADDAFADTSNDGFTGNCDENMAGMMGAKATEGTVSGRTTEKTEERFDRILRDYGRPLARLTFGYEKSAGTRDELMQEIALAIWQALPHFRGECSERTFIYRIAHNCSLTHVCRRRPAHASIDDLPSPAEPVDPRPHPDEQLARAHQRDRLRSAIQRLPLVYRQVLMLMLEELSQAEMAEVLGISENNVAVRLNRARKALKAALQEERP